MDNNIIEGFIRKQKVAFICSIDENGFPNVKAMLKPRKIEGLKGFYFSTNTSSMRVKQYMNNPKACIYFYHKGLIKYVGVMLKGKMEVLTDQETKDMIWRKGDTMFYKGGVTDSDYCVLKFTAESGRYYCDLKTESFTIEQQVISEFDAGEYMNTRDFLNILHVAERLKDTTRHCTTSKRRVESVAEHSWRVSLMASLLRSEFSDVDIDKVVNMCLIHDLGECFTGDIPAFNKTDQDRDIEDALLGEWVESLPKEVSDYMNALFAEMNAQETKESKLYKALDKLEALIQHNESPIDTWSENEYELNKTYAFENVEFSEWLTELRKDILQDTIDKTESEKPEI